MTKYLRNFSQHTNYETFIAGEYAKPNVSYCIEENEVHYNEIEKASGDIGDIVIFKNNKLTRVSPDKVTSSDVPVGIIVIPAKYTPDNKDRMMSLVEMSWKTPETGEVPDLSGGPSNVGFALFWGDSNVDISTLNNYQHVSTSNSTFNEGWFEYMYENGKYWEEQEGNDEEDYSQAHVPQLIVNGELNSAVDTGTSVFQDNVLSEGFAGAENTAKIMAIQSVDWSGTTLTNTANTGNYPATCACQRFHTQGTSAGDWYLPCVYELLFVASMTTTINNSLQTLIDVGHTVSLVAPSINGNIPPYWTSTGRSSHDCWSWFPMSGGFNYGNYKVNGYLVRSFCAL